MGRAGRSIRIVRHKCGRVRRRSGPDEPSPESEVRGYGIWLARNSSSSSDMMMPSQ